MFKKFIFVALMLMLVVGCERKTTETGTEPSRTQAASARVPQTASQQDYYLSQGIAELKDSDFGGAIKNFDEAIKSDPMNPKAYLVLGQVYLNIRNMDKAIDTFTAATKVDPKNGEACYLLATSLGIAGQLAEATEKAERCIELFREAKDQENFVKSVGLLQGLSAAYQKTITTTQQENK